MCEESGSTKEKGMSGMRDKMVIGRERLLFTNKALAALILPLIVEQFLAVLVGMADSVMVASVGEAAVSGVSLVDNIMILFTNLFAALATGGAVIAGQYLGQKNGKLASRAATQLIWFTMILAVVIMAVIYCGKWFILHVVFGEINADVMGHANTYLVIVTASIPFIALYNAGAAVFRAMGNSKVSMQVAMIMNVVNVAGNAILIYGFRRGTEGVAIPTLVSRITAAVLILVLLSKKENVIHMEKTLRFRPDWIMVKRILGIGIPNGLENSMFQLGKIMVLSIVTGFGTASIAANAVSNNVATFATLPGMAIGFAMLTVVSQCVGAGDFEQVKYYTKKLIRIIYISALAINVLVVLAVPFVVSIYGLSEEASSYARQILFYHSACVVTIWPLSFSLPNTLRAAADVKFTMGLSIFSMWVFRIGFSVVLGIYFHMGVFGVWVAMTIDWLFRSICFVTRYIRGKWKHAALV